MSVVEHSWSTQQLAEFLAALSSSSDSSSAGRAAVERAAEALEAEVGALVQDGCVAASIGFASGHVPERELLALAEGRTRSLEVPGVGLCSSAVALLDEGLSGSLVLARSGGDFSHDERALLRGMGRVLALTLRMLHTLEAERVLSHSLHERQRLLERLSRIQRSMSHGAPRDELLDAIVAGALELLGDTFVVLRLLDPEDPTVGVAVAHSGLSADVLESVQRVRVGQGVFSASLLAGDLVVLEQYGSAPGAIERVARGGLQAAMAAPVHENGVVVGGLIVGSFTPGRTYSDTEREMLEAFAEHASIALIGAKTVEAMTHQALHDALTGLPNRALFLDRLRHSLERGRRPGCGSAVLFLDLDRFKAVNDSLGHEAGDCLLVAFAERLRGCVREADTAARLGGDEFAVLLEDVRGAGEAGRLAERITEALQEPFLLHDREHAVTVSIGVAFGGSNADLLRNADVAMYRVKAGGEGGYEFFEPTMRTAVLERLELENDLRRAVRDDQLVLHFQPIVNLATGKPVSLEALVRWQHPQRGLLPPLTFVPLAEEAGTIIELGNWVLTEACRHAARWQRRYPGEPPLSVSVNLSGRQLEQPRLLGYVVEALARADLDPGSLVLEITETILMRDTATTMRRLRALKDLGVRLAVDDYGTGYSALRYLRQFPLDVIKIAKPFVDGIERGFEDSALARAIVGLGETFGLDVVAEGIETMEQVEVLRELRCELGQGFVLDRPCEVAAVDDLLSEGISLCEGLREPVSL